MLENVNLQRKLSKQDYQQALPALQRRLYDLEKACWDHGIPSALVFEGWEAAGKGGSISALTQRLDPRGFKLYTITEPRTHETNYPWLRRFWLRSPNKGEMVIMDHSWYLHVLDERVDKAVTAGECRKAYTDIVEFERMLAADGCVFVKLWFHISKDEQKRRFRAIEKDPFEAWQVTARDWKRHEQYEEYLDAAEQMLEMTESSFAPWTIIEATSKWWARKKVFEVAISALEYALGDKAPPVLVEPKPKREAVKQVAEPVKPEESKPKDPKPKKAKKVKPKKEKAKKEKDKKGKAIKPKTGGKPEAKKAARAKKVEVKAKKEKAAKPAAKSVNPAAPKPEKKGGKTNA
ncbi:MAG: hypothetical protein IH602_15795 [Bryobacteraceae bacterium]|nr:hypothetical protein [Bryobacteraceae bacterium]